MFRKSVLAVAAALFFMSISGGIAQDAAPADADKTRLAQASGGDDGIQIDSGQNKADANAGTVTIMTTRNLGSPFMNAALDLSNLLDAGEQFEEMRVIPVVARGKVQNLWDILYLKGIDMGFVQSDTFEYLKNDPRIESIKERLRYITVMYPEEVHVIARKEIKSLQDLEGKKVSINAKGTGSAMVGELLFSRLGIKAELVHEDTRRAVARMKQGELFAHFNVLGKPTRVVSRIDGEGKLHLLPIPFTKEVEDVYFPSSFNHEDYPNLIPEGETVQTIAAGNVLAAFNWPEDTARGAKIKRFVHAFFDRFEELKEPGYHPKWKEVNLAATLPGWERFPAAQEWLDENRPSVASGAVAVPAGADTAQLRKEFDTFLNQTGNSTATAEQRNAIFKQFIEWRQSQAN